MSHSSSRFPWMLCFVPWLAALDTACGATPDDSSAYTPPTTDGAASSGTAGSQGGSANTGSGGSGAGPGTAEDESENPLGRARCRAPEGVSASPESIEEALALLNALPKPTSVACFVESLDRPIAAYATNSSFSAQPALSAQSPRVFIKFGQLWISIVIDGDSSNLIEFGYLLDDMRSVKGELEGPFTEPLAPSAPYDRVLFGVGTICGVCHSLEEREPSVTFATAFKSLALRPVVESHVGLDELANEAQACDWSLEPHRCEMLSALFDGGLVVEESFPSSMPTFF